MKHRWLAVLLAICTFLGVVPNAAASTSYDDTIQVNAIFEAAYEFFAGHEGHYDSVAPKDVNAVSIGRLQWHAVRAHALLRKIIAKNPAKMAGLLSNALYNEIVNQPDSSWNTRILTAEEAAMIKAVLQTPESHAAQDEQAYTDICSYIDYGWRAGLRSNATLMYYCSVENQYGHGGAQKWMRYVRQTLGITETDTLSSLEALHTAAHNTEASFVQNYIKARDKVYNFIVNLGCWNLNGPDSPVTDLCPDGHTWDDGVETTAPTCTCNGVKTYACLVCGATTTGVIPALSHAFAGNGKCSRCGEMNPTGPSYPSAVFADVPEDAWYRPAIDFVVTEGLFNGTSETSFSPNHSMTRGMLVTVIYRMENKPYVDLNTMPFTDVRMKAYYAKPVLWAYQRYIVNGVSQTKFAPDRAITMEQLITILYRYDTDYLGNAPESTGVGLSGFADSGKVSKYAKKAMTWAVETGILTGTEINGQRYLSPGSVALRHQVAVVLMRYRNLRNA